MTSGFTGGGRSVLESFLVLVDDVKIHPQLCEDVANSMKGLQAEKERYGLQSEDMAPVQQLIEFDDAKYFGPEAGLEGGD